MALTSTSYSLQQKLALKAELNQAYLEEETYWQQKSRVLWLRSGDRNISYFHAITKAKRVRNTINSIQDDHRVIFKGQKEVAGVAINYFDNLYKTEGVNQE